MLQNCVTQITEYSLFKEGSDVNTAACVSCTSANINVEPCKEVEIKFRLVTQNRRVRNQSCRFFNLPVSGRTFSSVSQIHQEDFDCSNNSKSWKTFFWNVKFCCMFKSFFMFIWSSFFHPVTSKNFLHPLWRKSCSLCCRSISCEGLRLLKTTSASEQQVEAKEALQHISSEIENKCGSLVWPFF